MKELNRELQAAVELFDDKFERRVFSRFDDHRPGALRVTYGTWLELRSNPVLVFGPVRRRFHPTVQGFQIATRQLPDAHAAVS